MIGGIFSEGKEAEWIFNIEGGNSVGRGGEHRTAAYIDQNQI
jgi:hypothetical protein